MIKKILLCVLIATACISNAVSLRQEYPFSKVVIWGHKLHSHTHAWIHWAFYRAFRHLGYDTYWLDNKDSLDDIDFSDTLFITEGQVDKNIPIRSDCYYILHNCMNTKYKPLLEMGHAITLQVFTNDVLKRPVFEVQKNIYIDIPGKIIYMPWATDLLPHEIERNKTKLNKNVSKNKNNIVYWAGTIGGGEFGNVNEIGNFKRACNTCGLVFKHERHISMEQNIQQVQDAFMAPAVVELWQKKQGYIP